MAHRHSDKGPHYGESVVFLLYEVLFSVCLEGFSSTQTSVNRSYMESLQYLHVLCRVSILMLLYDILHDDMVCDVVCYTLCYLCVCLYSDGAVFLCWWFAVLVMLFAGW